MICCLATDRGCLNTLQEGTENMYMTDIALTLNKCGSLKYTHALILTNNEIRECVKKGLCVPYSPLSRLGSGATLVNRTKAISITTELKV